MSKILGVHIPAELKNLAINGAMDFFQRVEANGLTVSASTNSTGYAADMFAAASSGSAKSYTLTRSTNVPSVALSGFASTYSLQYTTTTALSTLAASDNLAPFNYRMEGLDFAKIHQKTATFGFWINVSISGLYSFAIRNQATTRSYVTTFSAAVGYQFVSITVPMDTVGAWNLDNTLGAYIDIAATCGTTYSTSALNSWQAGNYFCATGTVPYLATAGATINVTQFSIVEGPLGFSATGFQRAGKDIQQELAMCQRYYEKSYDVGTAPGTATFSNISYGYNPNSSGGGVNVYYQVRKRTAGTVTTYSEGGVINSTSDLNFGSTSNLGPFPTIQPGIGGHSAGFSASWGRSWHWTADAGL